MSLNKVAFTVNKEGAELKLAAFRPNVKQAQKAKLTRIKSFTAYLKEGIPTKSELKDLLRKSNQWNDAKEEQEQKLIENILKNEQIVNQEVPGKNGKSLTKQEIKEAAVQMRVDRFLFRMLRAEIIAMESNCADDLAEQDEFNYLVSECTKYEDTGERYFADLDDFLARMEDEDAQEAISAYSNLYYNYDPESIKKLPENVTLLKLGLCDDKLNLVDGKGRKVDVYGRLINSDGLPVNEDGKLIDENGNVVQEKTLYPIEDDEPIVEAKTENVIVITSDPYATTLVSEKTEDDGA